MKDECCAEFSIFAILLIVIMMSVGSPFNGASMTKKKKGFIPLKLGCPAA